MLLLLLLRKPRSPSILIFSKLPPNFWLNLRDKIIKSANKYLSCIFKFSTPLFFNPIKRIQYGLKL